MFAVTAHQQLQRGDDEYLVASSDGITIRNHPQQNV